MQNEGELGKNNQQFQKGQVELPDWVDPETGIDRTTLEPYVKIPLKPVEKAAKIGLSPLKILPAWADQIFIMNSNYSSNANVTNVTSKAEAAGHTVTSADSYPSDVSSYNQIWDMRYPDALSSSEITKLKTVLENGGTVYLTGEHSGLAERNNSITSFIQDVGGGSAAVGSGGSIYTQFVESAFRTPNNITQVRLGGGGWFSNLGNGTAITKNSSGTEPATAVWYDSDLSASYPGKIIVVLDVNIFSNSTYYDNEGYDNPKFLENLVALAETSQAPTISSAALASDNTYIDVTMSAAVYNAIGGSDALEATDFTLTFAQNSGSATAVSISSIKQNDNTAEASATALAGGETVIRFFLSITGTPSGVETITITPVDGSSIYDESERAMASSQTTGAKTLNDKLAPTISSVSLAANNSTIAVTFSDAVYNTDGGSGALEASDFAFSISGGTATLSSATPSSISPNSNVYTLGIGLSGTSNGTEVLTVNPVDDGIYDAAGNEASTTQSNNTATLNDVTGPTITSVSSTTANGTYGIGDEIAITITFSENVIVNSALFEQDGTGRPRLTLETGSSDQSINYTSGSGGATLTWNYTVQSGNISSDLDYQSTTALALNSGTIKDATGNDADLTTLPSPGASGSLAANKALVVDGVVPTIYSAAVASNNSYIDVNMSEAVYNASAGSGALEATDFTLTFAQNSGSATGASISSVKQNDSATESSATALAGGETTIRVFLTTTGTPSGVETIAITPVNATSIYDVAGNAMATSQTTGAKTLNDNLLPTITSVSLAANNSTISVTLSESVYNTNGSSGALEASDFAFSISGGTATLSSATPSSISPNGNVYTLSIDLSGTPNGAEVLTVNPVDDSIYDAAGNEASTTQSNNTATLNDQVEPTISSVSLASNNSSISVTFSEAVFNTNGGSGALEASDFAFSISGGVATLSSATPSSISPNGNVYKLGIDLSGTPNGTELLTVNPVDDSIYDAAGNEASTSQSNNTATLNDDIFAIITSVSLAANNSTLAVTFSEAVYKATGGSGALEVGDFVFSITLGDATLSSTAPTSISISGNVYTLGIGLSGNPNGNEVLVVNPVYDSIYDAAGNKAGTSQSNNTATLNEKIVPIISSVALASDNSALAVTFSEAVYKATGGSGALEPSDFAFSITGGTAYLTSDNKTPGNISISGNVYTLSITLTGTPDGSEVLTVNPVDDSIYDTIGNEASTSQSNNTATLNDNTVPTVTSVSLAANNSTLAVTFSEAVYKVTGGSGALEPSDFVFSISGGTATLTSTAPSSISIINNVYTLGIRLSGNPNGNEVLVVTPVDDSIYDAAGNEASTSQSNNTATLNDDILPIITSVALASDNSALAVTFSEAVYKATGGSGALEPSDFAFSISGGVATLSSATPSSISPTVIVSPGKVYTLGIELSGNANGNEVLVVNPVDDSIYDAAGNEASTSQSNNTDTLNDNTVPTVTSVSSITANGTYSIGSLVQVTTIFSEEVLVTGTPQITLETGTTNRTVNYAFGSGTDTLTFNYTVASGDTTPDLDYTAPDVFALNSGTIKDAAGNAATLTLVTPGATYSLWANKDLVIDGNAPTVSSVTSTKTNGAYSVSETIPISVTFNQTVAVTGTPQLTVETGSTDGVANYVSVSGATITFNYIVASGHTSSDLDYTGTSALTLNSGTIKDASGNTATLTLPAPAASNSLGANKSLIIDTASPTVTSVSSTTDNGAYNAGDTINVSVTFSENTVVTGTPQITMETGTADGTGNYVSGSGTTVLSFDYIVASGHHSADLDYENTSALILNAGTLKDAQGNNAILTLASPGATNSLGASKAILIDNTVPLIHSAVEGGILGIDGADYQSASTTLDISWSGSDSLAGIYKYEYALGTTSGGTETISWTDASTNPDLLASTSVSLTGLTLTDATKYYVSARGTDKAGNVSAIKTGDGMMIDLTAPKAGAVHDGTGADIAYTSAANTLSGNWTGFSDVTSGITDYQYAIGTTSGGIDVKGWTSNTTDTSFTLTGYNLTNAQAYYLSVKAIDMVGHVSDTVTSNGVIADQDAPTKGIVIDGLTADRALTNTDTIYASWSGFADTLSGINKYQYGVGRSIGASDVVDWTDNGLDTTITIKPLMEDANIYYVSVRAVDHVNNTSSVSTSDGVRADYLPPSIIAVSIEEWSTLPILSNATITFTTSEPITAATTNVVSYAGDTVTDTLSLEKDLSTNLISSITVELTSPFTSGDEMAVKINGLTDMAGNVINDLVYLYNIALLGDYDLDGDIGVTDLAAFTGGWAAGDLTLELGPTIGAAPNLKPIPDGKFNARDMMAFTRMWHWNTSKLGKVGAKVLANQGKALNAVIENDHIVFNPPRGTRAVELILDYPATDIQFSILADQQVTAEEGLILSNVDTLNGSLVYQVGYFEVNNKPVRINTKHLQKNDIIVNLSYQFIGDDNIVLSAGSEALELTPVPKEFSLHQNYPNPFNPITTINYDLPKDAYVNLVIYDILGREVINLVGKDMSAGYQTVIWNTRNQFGSPVAAGIYFYQIQTRDFVKTKKMVLLK